MKKQIRRLPPRPAGRDRSSHDALTPAPELSRSPNSAYSTFSSSQRSSSSSASSSSHTRAAVRSAARFVVGVFVACLTPPEYEVVSQKPSGPSHNKRIHVSSGTPANGGKNGGSAVRGGSRHSYGATQTREHPGGTKFTIEQIYKATRNFSPSLKVGQGGFGTVYKGTLDDGTFVAIKRAKKVVHDDRTGVEFHREIQTLTQVEHLNLVQFYGFLEEEDERIVVVEYVPNGTLREHLDGKRGDLLNFSMRLDLAIDVAHAITYLHTYTDQPIIHRDIKSSNILLTDNCRAKVADFGFSRLAADRDSGATHVSTQVKGTAGYIDPEYIKTYQLTDKSDVYSFGALLVELVTGRRTIESKRESKERVTARWAIKKFMEGDAVSVLDPRLERNTVNTWALDKILQLALQCLAPERNGRPSMKRCAEILWSVRKEYREVSAPSHTRSSSVVEEE